MTSSYQSRYLEGVVANSQCVDLRPEFFEGDILSERMMLLEKTQQLQAERYSNSQNPRKEPLSDEDDDAPEDYM